MSTVTVMDTTGAFGVMTVDRDEVASSLRAWYPSAPAKVLGWLDDLQRALNRGEYTGDLEAALAIEIDESNTATN